MVVDNTLHAYFQRCTAEIDQQTDAEIHEAQMGQKLLAMHGCNLFNGLQLDGNQPLHKNIDPKRIDEHHPLEFERYFSRSLYARSSPFQILGQHNFIHRLQQPGPERRMNLDRRIKNFSVMSSISRMLPRPRLRDSA